MTTQPRTQERAQSSLTLSLAEFIAILGPLATKYTPQQLELLRQQLCIYADLLLEIIQDGDFNTD